MRCRSTNRFRRGSIHGSHAGTAAHVAGILQFSHSLSNFFEQIIVLCSPTLLDGEQLDELPDASIDAITCCNGLGFMHDQKRRGVENSSLLSCCGV